MDYAACLRYLYEQLPMYQRIGPAAYKADLGNTLALLEAQGNPEKRFRSIHIAGTNGKGSVSHLLASVLQSAGYSTGLYTSPHLKDFRERIRINGGMIPQERVVEHVAEWKPLYGRIRPSFFEMSVGMAFSYFAEEQVDVAVIETGLGGRLDSTNVVTPLLSVITTIGHDHMQFLGHDLASIAREKAGIIKPGVPAVIGEADAVTGAVFDSVATAVGAPLHYSAHEVILERMLEVKGREPLLVFDAQHRDDVCIPRLACPLTGHYQASNFRTVISALHHLRSILPHGPGPILEGFRRVKEITGLRGRWEVLSERPFIVADTAHNAEGLKATMAQWMQRDFTDRHVVLGMVEDKDAAALLELLPRNARYYFCRPDVPRGRDAQALRAEAVLYGLNGEIFPSVGKALDAARRAVSLQGSIYIGGSTFVVAEVI